MSLTVFFGLLGGLLVLAFTANRLARWTRVPDAVVLIATGVLVGPILHLVDADRFQSVAHGFGTLALILVLFEGGLELDLRETLQHFGGGLVLAIFSYVATVLLVGAVARSCVGLSRADALLVGAVLGCVSSTIMLPVLQQIPLRTPVKLTLLVESSFGDVLAVLTVGALLHLAATGQSVLGGLVGGFFYQIGGALLFGVVAGFIWSRLLPLLSEQRFWQVLTLAAVLLIYASTSAVGASGLFAVLTFGVVLANLREIPSRLLAVVFVPGAMNGEYHQQILSFHAELAFLVRTFFFVLLGLLVKFSGLRAQAVAIVGCIGALIVARWLAVQGSRWAWRDVTARERDVILLLFPRGLITAVLAIEAVEARAATLGFLISMAFAAIIVTNFLVVMGSLRGRALAGATPDLVPDSPVANEGETSPACKTGTVVPIP